MEHTDQDLSESEFMDDPERQRHRPHLITRLGAAFLDMLVYAAMMIGLFYGCKAIFYGPMGYNAAREFMMLRMDESHLFVHEGQFYYTITERYDETKDALGNYHEAIVYYYSNCEYPLENHKLDEYYAYLDSHPEMVTKVGEGQYVRTDGISDLDLKIWLAIPYDDACNYLYGNAEFIHAGNKRTVVTYFNFLIAQVVAAAIYFIAVPLILPHGATFFKWVFRFGLEDKRTREDSPKGRLLLRYTILVIWNYLLPVFIYFFVNTVGWIGIILVGLDALMIGVTPSNSGLEDFAGRTSAISFRVAKKRIR